MENIEQFIEDTILELAIKVDQVSMDDWVREVISVTTHKQEVVFGKKWWAVKGRRPGLCQRIVGLIEGEGWQVTFGKGDWAGDLGICNHTLNHIRVADYLGKTIACVLLFHEWAHGLLHGNLSAFDIWAYSGRNELEAETTAYVVARYFGITPNESPYYIRLNQKTGDDMLVDGRVANIKRAALHQIKALLASGLK